MARAVLSVSHVLIHLVLQRGVPYREVSTVITQFKGEKHT